MTDERFESAGLMFLDGFVRDNQTNTDIADEHAVIKLMNRLDDENRVYKDILNQILYRLEANVMDEAFLVSFVVDGKVYNKLLKVLKK